MPWLDKPGATHLWAKIKAYVNSVIPKADYSKANYTSFSGSVVSTHHQSGQTADPSRRRVADYQRLGQCILD